MDTSTMVSALAANGTVELPVAMIGDLCDLDHRIKHGDESGWRGDISMGIFMNQETHRFEVWGIDAHSKPYLACSSKILGLGIIHQLRDGDPQKHDVWAEVLDANAKTAAAQDAANHELLGGVAEKLAWGIKRDFKSELGTVRPMSVPRVPGKDAA